MDLFRQSYFSLFQLETVKMFDKLKLKSKGSSITAADPVVKAGAEPTKKLIYQSRRNFGVNIGACFVLEKWIFHELFPEGTDCELDAVTKVVKDKGKDGAREAFENHWINFMNDDDWKWLQEHKVTSIRVPLGYWDVDGGKFTNGTRFSKVKDVYQNAWKIFKEKFVEPAGSHGISVLVDIHGLPNGANGNDHSGEKSGGEAGFWNSGDMQLLVCDMLRFIAKDLKKYDNICGIQIVNESEFANNAKRQERYYAAAINLIREHDKDIPVIISDGWWPDQWAKWVQSNQGEGQSLGVVIDHHCYRCFSDDDKKKSPRQITEDLDKDLLTNLNNNGEGVDLMVGEYSCVIDGESWKRDGAQDQRDNFVVDYGRKQSTLLSQRATFGSYFWTFKFQSGNGGEWDFKTMVNKGAIEPLTVKDSVPDENTRNERLDHQFKAHCDYWNNQNPKEKYEHDRYKQGFEAAWNDATAFAKFNGSTIGRVYPWKIARLQEHIKKHGSLKHLWEFEQGYESGLAEFASS